MLQYAETNRESEGDTLIEQQFGDVRFLQFSHFQQFPEMTHGVFTRVGGYSEGVYRGLNTSTPPRGLNGDSIVNVVRNRMLALQALGLATVPCVSLWQIHSADVVRFLRQDEWRADWAHLSYYEHPWTPASIRKGDALLSQEPGAALSLSFADCVPILLYDPTIRVIALAHGGWRGTARGIVLATVEAMAAQFGCRPQNMYAGIAPGIGSCCYEVSVEVQQIFQAQALFDERPTREQYRGQVCESAVFSHVGNSLRLDLQATNRQQLLMAGLPSEQIEVMDICTGCHTERFFSHRCEHGRTGRFAVVTALRPA